MTDITAVWKNEERAVFRLRTLYRARGYMPYQMSKFEEYDLYARNKHFLVSESVITFTDTNGKLMALKPDVTLSIIKNTRDEAGAVKKLYYDENVYRVSKGTRAFRELTQVGLECIGDVDDYAIAEVLALAADSLAEISPDYVLDVSDLELFGAVLADMAVSEDVRAAMLQCIGEKNLHGLAQLASDAGVEKEKCRVLWALLEADGDPAVAIPALRALLPACEAEIDRLAAVIAALDRHTKKGCVRIDFSVVNDMSYYNGIVFRGFVRDVPAGVLSGGQYDRLMEKMGRHARAIGFAVYLDLLERLGGNAPAFDVDTVLLYDETTSPDVLCALVDGMIAKGARVMAVKAVPNGIKYRELMCVKKGEVSVLEANA